MVYHITVTPSQAHALTKDSKKKKYYFRTLMRTDKADFVECETNCPRLPWKQ